MKDTSAEAVRRLRALGLTPILLTGDNRAVAESVAAEVGIDEVYAEVMPQDKVDVVKRLQAEGRSVAMVGDGVNDAAALAQADLGLAMGTGTDAAIEAGDLTLVRGDLNAAADAIRLSRRTLSTIRTNLFWAFAYNVAALPLAAAGLLNPMIAGAAMAFSSVFVVGNSCGCAPSRGRETRSLSAAGPSRSRRAAVRPPVRARLRRVRNEAGSPAPPGPPRRGPVRGRRRRPGSRRSSDGRGGRRQGRPSGGTWIAPSTMPSLGSSSVRDRSSGGPSVRRPMRLLCGETR